MKTISNVGPFSVNPFLLCYLDSRYSISFSSLHLSNIAIAIFYFSLFIPIDLLIFQLFGCKSCCSLPIIFIGFSNGALHIFYIALWIVLSLFCDSNSSDRNICGYILNLRAKAKSKGKLIAISFKSKKERQQYHIPKRK